MKRRQFLQTGSLVSLPIILGGMEVSAISRSSIFSMINNGDDKVLILIQLNGGNDGLNMVIPVDQYAGLSQVRPGIMLPESSVLKLVDKTGIHPAMTGLQNLFQEEKLAVVQSVGYPNQNRSHFRSTDIWTSASDSDEYLSSGWMGRYLDIKYPGFPTAYPNADCPDPFAITLGSFASETCQGPMTNFSYTLTSEASVKLVPESVPAPLDGSCYGNELDFIRTMIKQSNAYASTVLNSFDKGNSIATYPTGNRLADQLKIVANLISGGLGTKIYVVNLGGFDTHANQVLIGDTANGDHAVLMKTISDAVSAFMQDCSDLGIQERVVGMTFSEFGRQIRANNSFGTDHGTAAPLMVFGSCVNHGVYGENPVIDNNIAAQEGVPMQFDFRSVYASLLIDWLGAKESDVKQLLFKDFQRIPFIKDCSAPSSADDTNIVIQAQLTPNPCTEYTYLNFVHTGHQVNISVFNAIGSQLEVLVNKSLSQGAQEVIIPMSAYAPGSYFVRLAIDNKVKTLKVVKV